MMARVFLPSAITPEKTVQSIIEKSVPIVFGCSGRALLCELLKRLKEENGGKRDEVLIPGYTCYSVAAAIVRAGLKINVYDLDPANFNPDSASLKKNGSEKTLAVLSQHLFGIPTPVETVSDIAEEVGAAHIEDAAQALGGTLHGESLGTHGEYGLFSFGRGKPLPLGGGGALIGKDIISKSYGALNKSSSGMKTMVACAVARIIGQPLFYGVAEKLPLGLGQTVFDTDFKLSGISSFSKRLLCCSDELLVGLNVHRRKIAAEYEKAFDGLGTVSLPENSTPVYPRYPVFIENDATSNRWRQFGIRRMYPKAIFDEPNIKPYLSKSLTPTPGASEIAHKLVTLPTHMGINDKAAKRISNLVRNIR